ncbi:MAG: exodeoxyribonuclease V subunit beta [Aquificaceae bacterium]|nr:MAG: exodeoxyribonuclease V subunit beta [Aquificaceae bacterium]
MQSLNPQTVPLKDINLIEASAGTGKTYTISLLYLRFVLESEPALSVDQILVVTYTTAATKELKDRIRLRLSDALMAFINEDTSGEYADFCENYERTESILRLSRALLNFDEAAIFTIHSFCQRALKDTAFDAGLAFETELLDNDVDLMQDLLDDYWRREFQQAPDALLLLLREQEITPDSLLWDIKNAVGKPYLKRLKPIASADISKILHERNKKYTQAITTWRENADDIEACLRNHEGLYANVVKALDTMIAAMRELALSETLPTTLPPKVDGLSDAKLKVKKGFTPPDHVFFSQWGEFLALTQSLNQDLQHYLDDLRNKVLDYLQQELPQEKRRKGVMSFDDLLLQLQRALQSNPNLSELLSTQYLVAMIDEFQDTDPIQYDIFQQIYSNEENHPSNTVFYVGDPKQAIYSFRGADIYTYQKASKNTQHQYTLDTNWRSHPQLIKALNHLFTHSNNPFFDETIKYLKVKAGQEAEPSLTTPSPLAPLRLWAIEDVDDKKRADLMDEIAELVAEDITRLLIAADKGTAHIADKPLEGGDIAVLVRSHTQGQKIKSALTQLGVACVQSSKESIFETREAHDINTLLIAIAEPSQEDNVRRALVSDLFAYKAADLISFDADADAWDDKLQAFQTWHQMWLTQGFIPMMRALMQAESVQHRLLNHSDGERRLTNLLHLSELIHSETRQNSRGLAGTLRWFQQQMQHASLSSDSLQLRLESDEKLVKIVTVHKSKGLEYGIVYCPYLWTDSIRSSSSDAAIMFHADDTEHTPCLDIGSAQRDTSIKRLEQETYAENMRLLYVALTRAKYHCTVVTAPRKLKGYVDRSALGWLLSNGETPNSKNFHVAYQQNMEDLVAQSSTTIAIEVLPESTAEQGALHYQAQQSSRHLSARSFSSRIEKDHRVSSFSGLSAGHHSETPDHDNDTLFNAVVPAENAVDEFPRGARAGSCLHEMYEHNDFRQELRMDEESEIVKSLAKWGFDVELAATAQALLTRSLQAPLSAELKLADLSNQQRLNEMEFYLPLSLLKVEDLKQTLLQYLPTEGWQVVRDAVHSLQFEQVRGYLKGYIDLIFEHQGQYYVADYKSNSLEDYDEASLFEAMAHAHYYLQYLIYSVALHRYLQKRLPDYHYETHFGGVYYLFIRGMSPDNSGSGVFYDLPPYALIHALNALFGGEQ